MFCCGCLFIEPADCLQLLRQLYQVDVNFFLQSGAGTVLNLQIIACSILHISDEFVCAFDDLCRLS